MKLCLSRSSIASYRICSQNFSYYVLGKNQLHLIKFTLRIFKIVFIQNLTAPDLKHSKMCPNWFLAQIQLHFNQCILRHFRTASKPKLNFILLKLLWAISKLCLGRNSIASYRQISRTTPICVSAKIHLNLLEKFLRHFQNVLQPKLYCIWLKLFQDRSKLCLSWKSIATCLKYPKTVWNFVWADVHLRRVEYVPRISHFAS